jgi:ATP-dependent protease ClpP protease subunit
MVANDGIQNAQRTALPQRRYDEVFLLLNSGGGSLDDGFSLYSLIRTIAAQGVHVTTVNMGLIASIANVPFLAGDKRVATPNALFQFHNFEWNIGQAQTMTRAKVEDMTSILDASRSQTLALFKSLTTLTDADFEPLKRLDSPIVRDATFAQQKGIVEEISFPNLPPDTVILNVDY